MREIKKVRFDGKLLIQYTEFTMDHDDRYTIECTDKPRPEFREALAALVDDVVELCEFSENEKKSLIVYGVTWTYSDKKGEQAVIEECMRYIDGDRAQMNLFEPAVEDKQEGA